MEAAETNNVTVEVPKESLEAFAATMYHIGVYSKKEACDLIKKTRREFDDILNQYGFPAIRDIDKETYKLMRESQNKY